MRTLLTLMLMPKPRHAGLEDRYRAPAGTPHRSALDAADGGPRKVHRTTRRAVAAAVLSAGLVAGPAFTETAAAEPYTVRSGDTLNQIAQRHGTTWRHLYQLNRGVLTNPNRISAGQALKVDGSAAEQGPQKVEPTRGRDDTTSGDSFGQRTLAESAKLEGVPYVYGGTSPSQGFDCSGFTSYVFSKAGKTLPRTSSAQAAASQQISSSQLRAGDLIFFRPSGRVSHVAIYAGNGMVWEAPGSGKQVRYAPIWDVPRSYGRI